MVSVVGVFEKQAIPLLAKEARSVAVGTRRFGTEETNWSSL
jgi:hypothetical protein